MDALDTNILVYLHRQETPEHLQVKDRFEAHLSDGQDLAIVLPCAVEFLSVVTNTRIFSDPTPAEIGITFLEKLQQHPRIALIRETEHHISQLGVILASSGSSGRGIHDARIATVCHEHGVHKIWTRDRDFRRFRNLKTVNPLE